jgi:hypothetical protein
VARGTEVRSRVHVDLHDIARQVATTAGADFAFVLSQSGLLLTRDAPRDMPDQGRMKILWACPAGRSGEVVHLDMPRQDLVPFGGAAPIDVFAVRVEDAAVLVAVMATWNDKGHVMVALTDGAAQVAELIRDAKKGRTAKTPPKKAARRDRAGAVPAEPKRETKRGDRTSAVPAEPKRGERTSALPRPPKEGAAAKKPARPRIPSEPEIEVGEAEVGRETMLVLDAFQPQRGSQPEIEVGEVEVGRETMLALEAFRPRRRSEPEIEVGEAEVGRETLFAIDAALPRPKPGPAPEGMRVQLDSISRESMLEVERLEASQRGRPTVDEPLVTERRTLPWVDSPASLKRTLDAREAARAAAPPEVNLGVEEMDPDALEQALREGR